jgi:hydroxymethylpyrimidine kinase/phosphomethylpyrimidine kinase
MPQVVLTIGGSDSGGGAGIQADLKTFSVLGLHGTSAITAITAQNTQGVQHIYGLEPEIVLAQLKSITDDFSVAYAKTGMLYSAEIVVVVADHLRRTGIPLVLDPVIEAEAGGRLLRPEAVEAVKKHLLPLARVATPNIFEAEALTGIRVRDMDRANLAAQKIMGFGSRAVIVKGGHLDCTDLLVEGLMVYHLPSERIKGQNHGVGCTFSAALTSYLAMGCSLKEAAQEAKEFAKRALRGSFDVGKGVGPVNQAAFLREEASRYHVLCDIRDAVDLLDNESNLFQVVRDPGSNLGMAIPNAATPDDVAFVEGGLVRDGRRVRLSGGIKFGAMGEIACIILAAMRFDPRARAAMNLSPKALPACKALGLAIMEINRFGDWEAISGVEAPVLLPDAILVKCAPVEEPRLYLLGASATLLARRVINLAGALEYRKI